MAERLYKLIERTLLQRGWYSFKSLDISTEEFKIGESSLLCVK